jgi:hypothetical protein
LFQAFRHESGNKTASVASGDPARQEFVIPRVRMPYMCTNGQFHRTRLELFGGSRAAYSTCVLPARVFGNRPLLVLRTPGKQIAHAPREALDVLGIEFLTTFCSALAGQPSRLGIREALLFRACESGFFYQHTLSLVPLPRTAEPDYHCTKRRIPPGAPRERGIATRQEHEMIEIGTVEAQWPFGFHPEEAPFPKRFTTLRAG